MRPEPIANSRTGPDPARRARQRDGRLDDLRREHLGGFLVVDGGGLLIPDTTADHAHRLPGRQPRCDAGTSRSPVSDTTPAPRSDSAIRPRRDDPNRGPPLCHSPEMDDVATGPRARSEGRAAGLASLVGVLVDLAFLGVYAAATATHVHDRHPRALVRRRAHSHPRPAARCGSGLAAVHSGCPPTSGFRLLDLGHRRRTSGVVPHTGAHIMGVRIVASDRSLLVLLAPKARGRGRDVAAGAAHPGCCPNRDGLGTIRPGGGRPSGREPAAATRTSDYDAPGATRRCRRGLRRVAAPPRRLPSPLEFRPDVEGAALARWTRRPSATRTPRRSGSRQVATCTWTCSGSWRCRPSSCSTGSA